MFDPIEWFKKFIAELVDGFANLAFDVIGDLMLKPTNFSDVPKVGVLYDFSFAFASSLSIIFLGFAILKNMTQNMSGNESRTLTEIMSKGILAFIAAASAPWILDKFLIKLNNAGVQYFLDKGLDMSTFSAFTTENITTGAVSLALMIATCIVMFVILAIQYIIRLGEYIVLLALSPVAAFSLMSEETELWSVWWREAISVVFAQALQVSLLWFFFDSIGSAKELEDYLRAAGMLFVIIKGPKWLRQMIYSSGAGKTAIGLAGGASKQAMYKYTRSQIMKG